MGCRQWHVGSKTLIQQNFPVVLNRGCIIAAKWLCAEQVKKGTQSGNWQTETSPTIPRRHVIVSSDVVQPWHWRP